MTDYISWRCETCGCTGSSMDKTDTAEEGGRISAMLHRAISPDCPEPLISAEIIHAASVDRIQWEKEPR